MDGWDGAGDVAVFCVVEGNSGAGGDENEGDGDDDIRSENVDDLVFLMAEVKTKKKKNEEKDRHVVGPVPLERFMCLLATVSLILSSLCFSVTNTNHQLNFKILTSYVSFFFFQKLILKSKFKIITFTNDFYKF